MPPLHVSEHPAAVSSLPRAVPQSRLPDSATINRDSSNSRSPRRPFPSAPSKASKACKMFLARSCRCLSVLVRRSISCMAFWVSRNRERIQNRNSSTSSGASQFARTQPMRVVLRSQPLRQPPTNSLHPLRRPPTNACACTGQQRLRRGPSTSRTGRARIFGGKTDDPATSFILKGVICVFLQHRTNLTAEMLCCRARLARLRDSSD